MAVNQLWSADITYVRVYGSNVEIVFSYLSLIIDVYSWEIIGYKLGRDLSTNHPLDALNMALKRLEGKTDVNLIHHSDRGCQYASERYVQVLESRGIKISMTENGCHQDISKFATKAGIIVVFATIL